jgi:hypothetical protein
MPVLGGVVAVTPEARDIAGALRLLKSVHGYRTRSSSPSSQSLLVQAAHGNRDRTGSSMRG